MFFSNAICNCARQFICLGTLDEAFVAMQERTGVMDALNYFLISIDDKIQSNADVHARCGGCGKENHKCMCWSINDKFRQVTEML